MEDDIYICVYIFIDEKLKYCLQLAVLRSIGDSFALHGTPLRTINRAGFYFESFFGFFFHVSCSFRNELFVLGIYEREGTLAETNGSAFNSINQKSEVANHQRRTFFLNWLEARKSDFIQKNFLNFFICDCGW